MKTMRIAILALGAIGVAAATPAYCGDWQLRSDKTGKPIAPSTVHAPPAPHAPANSGGKKPH